MKEWMKEGKTECRKERRKKGSGRRERKTRGVRLLKYTFGNKLKSVLNA